MFGSGTYFDGIDVGEACAHEYAAAALGAGQGDGLRAVVGDPCDLGGRPVNLAISTLTVRHDRATGEATFLLHWRDPKKVGHGGGLYQVIPVGIFQASSDHPTSERNDFSLWRCMIREYAEELLGESEEYGSDETPIDYDAWPFAERMTAALRTGQLRAYCLALGVDPLTFATDLLTVVVFNAPLFDDVFGGRINRNAEGQILSSLDSAADSRGIPFRVDAVDRFAHHELIQAAGAALLALAWQSRQAILA